MRTKYISLSLKKSPAFLFPRKLPTVSLKILSSHFPISRSVGSRTQIRNSLRIARMLTSLSMWGFIHAREKGGFPLSLSFCGYYLLHFKKVFHRLSATMWADQLHIITTTVSHGQKWAWYLQKQSLRSTLILLRSEIRNIGATLNGFTLYQSICPSLSGLDQSYKTIWTDWLRERCLFFALRRTGSWRLFPSFHALLPPKDE